MSLETISVPSSVAPETPVMAAPPNMAQVQLNSVQLFSLCIGFLGIQFAWSIQGGQISPFLESLGATPSMMSYICAAAPITGILVQPLVGSLSDRCTHAMGRRRPFLVVGAILSALSLLAFPWSGNLLMAGLLLWVLDASINLTQGPYRALVPDTVPVNQQPSAYAQMGLVTGLGAVVMFLIGYALGPFQFLGHTWKPFEVIAIIGGITMLATMAATINAVQEKPYTPPPQQTKSGVLTFLKETLASIMAMSPDAKKLCLMHSFTWFGLFCFFVYFNVFVPHNIFHADSPTSALYTKGVQWGNLCMAVFNAVCFVMSMAIAPLCRMTSKKLVHTLGLLCLGGGLLFMTTAQTPAQAMMLTAIMGIGWATTLSLPFTMLTDFVSSGKEGVLMGSFNIFIALPQLLATLIVGPAIEVVGNDRSVAMVMGGAVILVSALLLQWVREAQPHVDA